MKRLYLRIYLAVIASIILSVVLAGAAWRTFGDRSDFMRQREFLVEAAKSMLPPATAAQEAQKAALDKWHRLSGFNMALLDRGGRVIAMAGEVDVGPSSRRRRHRWRDNWYQRIRLGDGRMLVGQHDPRRGGPLAGLGILMVLLLIGIAVAIAAFPFVRRLTRRLEALEGGVAAFGAGNLGARVDIKGKDEVARLAATFNQSAEPHRDAGAGQQDHAGQCLTRIALATGTAAHGSGSAWRSDARWLEKRNQRQCA